MRIDEVQVAHAAEEIHNGESTSRANDETEFGKRNLLKLRSTPLFKMKFHDQLAATGIRHLYGRIGTTRNQKSYDIELSTLQRMVIHDLQRKLVLT